MIPDWLDSRLVVEFLSHGLPLATSQPLREMFLRKWGRICHHKISSIREYPKACCLSIFKKAQILVKRKSSKVPKNR